MNKLLGYFVKKKDASSDVDFPQLEKEEEEEIQKHLGIPENSRMNTRSLLMATLKNFSQYENDEFDCEAYMAAGTVRIKDKAGEEVIGTVRLKKGEEFGTVKYLGTVRINPFGEEEINTEEEMPEWADFGTIRITADDIASGQIQLVSPRSSGIGYVYRPPEDWELNILSLEQGEWAENMSEDAFGKFRKRRGGVQNLFTSSAAGSGSLTNSSSSNLANSTSSVATTASSSSKHHEHHKSKEKKEKHHKPHGNKSPSNARTDKHQTEKDKSDKSVGSPDKEKSDRLKSDRGDKDKSERSVGSSDKEKSEKYKTDKSEKTDKGDKDKSEKSVGSPDKEKSDKEKVEHKDKGDRIDKEETHSQENLRPWARFRQQEEKK